MTYWQQVNRVLTKHRAKMEMGEAQAKRQERFVEWVESVLYKNHVRHAKLMDGKRKIKSVQERHIHQEPAQSSWTERLLWFISLSWLGVCYLMFTDVSGWRKLVILTVAILPFAVYWYWESRKNRAYHEDDE